MSQFNVSDEVRIIPSSRTDDAGRYATIIEVRDCAADDLGTYPLETQYVVAFSDGIRPVIVRESDLIYPSEFKNGAQVEVNSPDSAWHGRVGKVIQQSDENTDEVTYVWFDEGAPLAFSQRGFDEYQLKHWAPLMGEPDPDFERLLAEEEEIERQARTVHSAAPREVTLVTKTTVTATPLREVYTVNSGDDEDERIVHYDPEADCLYDERGEPVDNQFLLEDLRVQFEMDAEPQVSTDQSDPGEEWVVETTYVVSRDDGWNCEYLTYDGREYGWTEYEGHPDIATFESLNRILEVARALVTLHGLAALGVDYRCDVWEPVERTTRSRRRVYPRLPIDSWPVGEPLFGFAPSIGWY